MIALRVAIAGLAVCFAASAAPCTNRTPSVTTDRSDYGALETVTIAGCAAGAREHLTVRVTAADGSVRNASGPETADDSGAFSMTYRIDDPHPAGAYSV